MAKYRRKYSPGGDLSYNGNPVTDNTSDNPYQENTDSNAGNYAGYATAAAGALGAYSQYKNDPSLNREQQDSMSANAAIDKGASSLTPWYGYAKGASQYAKNAFIKYDEAGNPISTKDKQLDAVLTPHHEYIVNDLAQGNYGKAAAELFLPGIGYESQSNAMGMGKNLNKWLGSTQMRMGGKLYCADGGDLNSGNLTQYEGYKHEMGGIPIGDQAEVEDGETRGLPNTPTQDYIYSDKLRVPGKKYTFAKASKMIEKKFEKRDNDKLSTEQKEREINALMQHQEGVRDKLMTNAYKKAFGGALGDPIVKPPAGTVGTVGNVTTGTQLPQNYPFYQEIDGKYYSGSQNLTPDQFRTMNRSGNQKLPYDSEISAEEYNKYKGTGNMMQPYRTKEYITNTTIPTFRMGGKMRYDGGGPFPGYNQPGPGAEQMQGQYPYTQEDIDRINDLNNFRIQNQNSRSSVDFANTESRGAFGETRIPNQGTDMETISRLPMTSGTQFPDQMAIKPVPMSGTSESAPTNRNFNPNSLYNAGNFLGAAYDIYRGAKGGDDVNYDRVNPDLVDYTTSRDLGRRDIKEGFRSTQKELRNVNNPAEYLSLLTQTAGTRDKTISDMIAKSYENERNTNAQIKNQSKYFNAQTQRGEADARQLEKDNASNTLSTGLYNAGSAIAQTGVDQKAYASQDEAKKLIGTGDYSYVYENGKIKGIKFNKTGKVTPIR